VNVPDQSRRRRIGLTRAWLSTMGWPCRPTLSSRFNRSSTSAMRNGRRPITHRIAAWPPPDMQIGRKMAYKRRASISPAVARGDEAHDDWHMNTSVNNPPWVSPRIKAASEDSADLLVRLLEGRSLAGDVEDAAGHRGVLQEHADRSLPGGARSRPSRRIHNRWAHRLSIEIEGDGVSSWAVCNHPTTLSP